MTTAFDGDPLAAVRAYFDALGEGEWDRHEHSPRTVVAFELYRRLLSRFIQPGWRVLEIGAGPGRFTIELATLRAKVVVSDISQVQLDLNAAKVRSAGKEAAVQERLLLDIRDLSAFADGAFDSVVAFGGPISYASAPATCVTRHLPTRTAAGCSVGGKWPKCWHISHAGFWQPPRPTLRP